MKNTKALFEEMVSRITIDVHLQETQSIAYLILESLLGLSRTEVMAGKMINLPEITTEGLEQMLKRINNYEPVQYVIGSEVFFGRKFKVNKHVLIPRPETEELIRVVMNFLHSSFGKVRPQRLTLLDIGTGSACIPITLFCELTDVEVLATDISAEALEVAILNARDLAADVKFIQHDILKEDLPMRDVDIIVSNPPYVTKAEMKEMNSNVLNHEPHLALFVPDHDPLVFYTAIGQKSLKVLRSKGLLAVEVNENFGGKVSDLFNELGFKDVAVLKDINNKDRIVKGTSP